jgi:hypothetical protein
MTIVTEIAHLRDRIMELRGELDKGQNLIGALREHIESAWTESNQTIKQWIASPGKGWAWEDTVESYNDLLNKYNNLVKKWNRYIGSLKTRRPIGRPLQASEVQQVRVRKLRRAGYTVREIAVKPISHFKPLGLYLATRVLLLSARTKQRTSFERLS